MCRQKGVSLLIESPSGAPGKERRAYVAFGFSEGFSSKTDPAVGDGMGEPCRSLGFRQGLWTGRVSRVRILASALGPALNRQAGFTAARPAAKFKLQWQTVLTVILDDRTLLTRAADRELSGASGTFRLSHDLLAQLIESG